MAAVIDLEAYLASHGAGVLGYGDAALHRSNLAVPASTWRRFIDAQVMKDRALAARRAELTREYEAKVAAGEIRPPSRRQRLEATAAGHPDNESVQAARRMLAKMAG